MPFNIVRNDITSLKVDAVVNAANSCLKAGGGVCGAIFSAAGEKELSEACDKIGFCAIGDAVLTKGFKLCKYIIHTVGPIYGQNPSLEENQLYSCYKNSLALAKKTGIESIAFPVISSGIYGYPKDEALRIASKAIKDFLFENDMTVYLVIYDRQSFSINEKLFASVKAFIDEKAAMPDCSAPEYQLDLNESAVFEDEIYPDLRSATICGVPKSSLDDLLCEKVETFSEMLLRLIDEKNMTDVEVYKRANIDRKLFSKIRKREYIPKKVTVMALIVALRLNMDEASDLLSRAGYAFSKASKFDIIIEYFIENKKYDIYEINETLFSFDQQLLGA